MRAHAAALALLALMQSSEAGKPLPGSGCFPPEAGVDAFRAEWFCRQLDAAQEGRLTGEPAYRFTYVPSFDPTRVVLVYKEKERTVVVGKVLSGAGGYEPGTVARTTGRDLSAEEWRSLEQRLEQAGLWAPLLRDERIGTDGAEWILEGRKAGRYAFHAVWSPDSGSFPSHRDAGTYMLELAGIRPEKKKELY